MIGIVIYILCCFGRRDDSVIAILCRNQDLPEIKKTLINFEEKFNKNHHYPYVFLNDEPWDVEFADEITDVISGEAQFGKIDPKVWDPPKDIDMNKAKKNWKEMANKGVPYAQMLSYHNMCRFFSRGFFHHPLLMKYKYYWRIEPSVRFRCPIKFDPFEKMAKNGYIYGFTIAIREWMESIPTLGEATAKFIQKNKDLLANSDRLLEFMFKDGKYNGCHFWSNFEIGDFDFFRGKVYTLYTDYLEKQKGFYYERWGDAPIHSLAVALFADKSRIHFFEKIGYTHPPFTHCPEDNKECDCTPEESIDYKAQSCLLKYLHEINSLELKNDSQDSVSL